jgi:hypothetical protein
MPLYEKFTGRHRDDFATLDDLQRLYRLTYRTISTSPTTASM